MNIAELRGEKSVKALAKRLLATDSKRGAKKTEAEMEAALLRLNPQLNKIDGLEKGTPVLVPDEFALASDESNAPLLELSQQLLQQSEETLVQMHAAIEKVSEQSPIKVEQLQAWLKSDQPKELIRESPELKDVFAAGNSAIKSFIKERSSAQAADLKAIDNLKTSVTEFRASIAPSEGGSSSSD